MPEDSSTATRTKVADIVIPDNILTGATITLSGADAARFEVVGKAIYLKAGATLDYEAQASYSILITFTGGIFDVRGPLTVPNSLAVGDVFETISLDVAVGQTLTYASSLLGTSKYVKTGPGKLILDKANSHTGGTDVDQGELVIRNVAALGTGPLHVKSGALVTFDVGTSGLAITSIIIDAGGKVDVGYGRFTLAAGSHSISTVRSLLRAGRGNGDWAGAYGITSRFASALKGLGLGYMSNSNGNTTIGFAASGDANIDNVIDILDVSSFLASGKFDQGLPAEWDEGDFNYDGILDVLDAADFFQANRYDKGTYVPASQAASTNSVAADDTGFLSPLQAAFAALAASVSLENPPVRKTRTAIR
jgi:autotransporter-associated beta strand protein